MKLKECYAYTIAANLILLLLANPSSAQDTTSFVGKAFTFPEKLFSAVNKKARDTEAKLDRQAEKYLSKLQKEESRLKRRLFQKDSAIAKGLFSDMEERYADLRQTPQNIDPQSAIYSAHLDSLSTAFHFLKETNIASIASDPRLEETQLHLKTLREKFNRNNQARVYLEERKAILKLHFEQLGLTRELRRYQKQVYYYQAQFNEYKQLFEDPHKLEAKLMEVLAKIPAFQDFFARNSQLAQLFGPSTSTGVATTSLQGLQTRALLEQLLQDRFGSGTEVTEMLRQNVRGAQTQLTDLKTKASQYTSGTFGNSGNGEEAMPDFKPNSQKTKSFLKRLEYGSNLQSQRARNYFPVTSDLGLSLGYKLNDKSVVGIGASYKLGLGNGWDNISISHQGLGLRSFLDYKIKGSIFFSGGYEQNYRSTFQSIEQLKEYSAWQSSGLIGLAKKYMINKKLKGNMQLLWDFLSYQQIPRTQAIVWRMGYVIK